MKLTRLLRHTLTALSLGVLALTQVQAAIADFVGSYEAKLASLETVPNTSTTVETFYGKIEVKVAPPKPNSSTASASGTLTTRAGKSYSFTTTFTQPAGSTSTSRQSIGVAPLKGTKGVFLINFFLTINANGTIVATGENFNPGDANATFFVAGSFKFAQFTGKGESVPAWLGNYTIAFANPSPSGASIPAGAGYASATVLSNGQLSYKGKTGDGAIITGTASPTADGDYSLFVKPTGYASGGYLSGVINLVELGTQPEPFVWTKPGNIKDKLYPAGFSTEVDAVVQEWFVPAKKAYPLAGTFGFAASKNFDVLFSGQGLSDGNYVPYLPKVARITGLSTIQAVSGGTGAPAENNSAEWNKLWNVKLNPLTGVFTGTQIIRHLVGTKLVDRKVTVEGVLSIGSSITKNAFAYGQYTVTAKDGTSTVTGLVSFHGPLVDNKSVATAGNYTVLVDVELAEISSGLSGGGTLSDNPTAPSGSPKDNQVVKFSISEDQQTLVFNGITLPLVTTDSVLGTLVYHKVTTKGAGGYNVQVSIFRSVTTGQINGLISTIQEISVNTKSFKTTTRTSTISNQNPISTTLIKL